MHQPVTQRKQVRLDETEMWLIATYCIENHCVSRDDGETWHQFRVRQTTIAEEINASNILTKKINANHVKNSMKWYMDMCMLFKKMPFQTPKGDSGEIEKLTDKITAEMLAYDNLNERLATSIMQVDKLEKDLTFCRDECKILDRANGILRKCFSVVRNQMSVAISDVGMIFDIK